VIKNSVGRFKRVDTMISIVKKYRDTR